MELKSRYGDIWELDTIENGYLWKNIPDHTRFGLFPDSKEDICFIDPPGGPFLEVGMEITKGEIIIKIEDKKESGFLIKTYKKEG